MRELHRAQVFEDAVIESRPQVVRQTFLVVVAVLLAVTLGRVHRLVDSPDDVGDRDVVEALGEEVPAAWPAHAGDERIPAQLPEQLLEVRERDALPFADAGERDRSARLGHREVEDRRDGESPFGGQPHDGLQFCLRGANNRAAQSSLQNPDRFSQPFGKMGVCGQAFQSVRATAIRLILSAFLPSRPRAHRLPAGHLSRLPYLCRSLNRWILPVAVLGNSDTNSTQRGYLYGAR